MVLQALLQLAGDLQTVGPDEAWARLEHLTPVQRAQVERAIGDLAAVAREHQSTPPPPPPPKTPPPPPPAAPLGSTPRRSSPGPGLIIAGAILTAVAVVVYLLIAPMEPTTENILEGRTVLKSGAFQMLRLASIAAGVAGAAMLVVGIATKAQRR